MSGVVAPTVLNRPEKGRPERTRGRDTGIVIAGSQQASEPESYELCTKTREGTKCGILCVGRAERSSGLDGDTGYR